VVPDGFVWQGTTYGSLSTIARAITGTAWGGPRFFGLRSASSKQEDQEPDEPTAKPKQAGRDVRGGNFLGELGHPKTRPQRGRRKEYLRCGFESAKTRAFLLLIGPNGVGPWQEIEYFTAFDRHVKDKHFVLVPAIVAGAEVPGLSFLRTLHWVEVPVVGEDKELHRLLAALKGEAVAPLQQQMVVLGSMSLGGNIVPVENLAESLQVAFDAGAKRLLLPMASVKDIPTIPGELFAKFQTGFYADATDAVFKALGVG
jgi:hypothetical protein